MNKILLLVTFSVCVQFSFAQTPKFSVAVSSDTILLGNYFELKFTIENAPANGFQAPDLHKFDIIGGPNTSSSMSIINGEVSQSSSYTYYLKPPDIGVYTIKPAYLTSEDIALETFPIDVIVIPNPDHIIQKPHAPEMRVDQFSVPKAPAEEKPTRPRKKF